jgi:hypothetical protein
MGEVIENIELVEYDADLKEKVLWSVAGSSLVVQGVLDFPVGAGVVDSLTGASLPAAALEPSRNYILVVDLKDDRIVLHEFAPRQLSEQSWRSWQGNLVTGDLRPSGCR